MAETIRRLPVGKADTETPLQAYDFHKLLEAAEESDDDNSSDDDSSDFSLDYDDKSTEEEGVGTQPIERVKAKHGNEGTSTGGHQAPTLPFVKVGIDDSMLLAPRQLAGGVNSWPPQPAIYMEQRKRCGNIALRQGMWASNPKVRLRQLDMGFLSQLAQLCLRASLFECEAPGCLGEKKAMDRVAPSCAWGAFRDWALVAMSCQAAMNARQRVSRAHTHLARAVSGICLILKDCLRQGNRQKLFISYLDGQDMKHQIDLADVSNLIYWMARIQSQMGVGPQRIGKWDHHFIPSKVTLPSIRSAASNLQSLVICKNRLWNLVNVSDRKQVDLPDIVASLAAHKESLSHTGHDTCSPSKCQYSQMNSTGVFQLHKCKEPGAEGLAGVDGCSQVVFPVELLDTNVELGKSTAWICSGKMRKLSRSKTPYITISHVWSDGTGVGVKTPGSVNECLYNYFAGLAQTLDCSALWWDAISIPHEPKARHKALSQMHNNYANARYTVVHDNYLVNFPWSDDEAPCLALVLSTWFTRGWTALELAMSKNVKVLFKDPRPPEDNAPQRPPLIKDLDRDILAQSPARASRAHWLATSLIQRLRRPIENAGDLVTTLAPRSTSWVRDRTVIAALLSGVPDCDFGLGESQITEQILKYVGKIPHSFLLHGKSTMRDKGSFSWSAATLDDVAVDTAVDLGSSRDSREGKRRVPMLDITEAGFAKGAWWCRALTQHDTKTLKPYGNDLSAMMKVNVALQDWERCVLLRSSEDSNDSRALVVMPTSIQKQGPVLRCQFIGTVSDESEGIEEDKPHTEDWTVEIGPEHHESRAIKAEAALKTLLDCYLGDTGGFESDEIFAPEINKKYDTRDSAPPREMISALSAAPSWLEGLSPDDSVSSASGLIAMGPPMVQRAELSSSSIVLAVKRRKENPIRYLIGNHVQLQAMDLLALVNLAKSDRRVCKGLKMLGDVYVENQLIRDAINVYRNAIEGFESVTSSKLDNGGELSLQMCRFALGHAYVALTKVDSRADQQPTSSGVLSANQRRKSSPIKSKKHQEECLAEALVLFDGVISACDDRHTSRRARKLERHTGDGTTADAEGQPDIHDTTEVANKPQDVIDLEIDWLRLELDTVAELTLLHGTSYAFKMAARTYKRAIKHFGLPPQELEGFKVCWPRRKIENFQSRNERDQKAAELYNIVKQRFNTLLRGDHPLVLLTYLQLGVNYSHQSKVNEAEELLKRAEKGFQLLSGGNTANSQGANNTSESQHPILALTRYHLGTVYLRRHKDKEAAVMFQKCRDTPCGNQEDGVVLKAAAALGLAEAVMQERKDRRSTLRTSRDLLEKAIRELENHGVRNDEHRRLVLEMRLGIAEVLYLLGGSRKLRQAKIICDEVISGIRNDLQNYGSRGDLDEAQAKTLLARIMKDDEEYGDACDLLYWVRSVFEIIEGPQSLVYLQATRRIGEVEMKLDNFKEAEMELTAALDGYDKHKGAFDESTLLTARHLALFYTGRKQLKDAAKHGLRAYEGWRKVKGDQHLDTADMARQMGLIYFSQCRFSEAKDMYFKAYDAYRRNSKVEDMEVAKSASWGSIKSALYTAMELAKTHAILGGPENDRTAVSLYNLVVVKMKERSKGDTVLALTASMRLGDAQRMRNQLREARPLIEHALKGWEKKKASNGAGLHEAKLKLAQLILDEQQQGVDDGKTDPTDIVREALSGLENTMGLKNHLTLEAKALLGELLIDDDDFGVTSSTHKAELMEGESHLTKALEGCQESFPSGHPTPIRIMDLLIKHWRDRGRQHDVKDKMKRKWKDLKEGFGPDHAAMIMQITDPKRENLFYLDDDDDEFDEEPVGLLMANRQMATVPSTATGSALRAGDRAIPAYGQMPSTKPMKGTRSSWTSSSEFSQGQVLGYTSRRKWNKPDQNPAETNARSPWVYYSPSNPTRTTATSGVHLPPGQQNIYMPGEYDPYSFENAPPPSGVPPSSSNIHRWENEDNDPSDNEDLESWYSDDDKDSLFDDQFDDLYGDFENMEASSGEDSSDWEDTTGQANNADVKPSHGRRVESPAYPERHDPQTRSTRPTGEGPDGNHDYPSSGAQNTGSANPFAPGWEPNAGSAGPGADTQQGNAFHFSGDTNHQKENEPSVASSGPEPDRNSPIDHPSGGDQKHDPAPNNTSGVVEPVRDVSNGQQDGLLSDFDVTTPRKQQPISASKRASLTPPGSSAAAPGDEETGFADGTDGFDGFGGFPGFFGPQFSNGNEFGPRDAQQTPDRPDQVGNVRSGGDDGSHIDTNVGSPANTFPNTADNNETTGPVSATDRSYGGSRFGDNFGRSPGSSAQDYQYPDPDQNNPSRFDNGYANLGHSEPVSSNWPGYGDTNRSEINRDYPQPNQSDNIPPNWSSHVDNATTGIGGNYPEAGNPNTVSSNWRGYNDHSNPDANDAFSPVPYHSGTPSWQGYEDATRSGGGTSYSNPSYADNTSNDLTGYHSSFDLHGNTFLQQPGPQDVPAQRGMYASGDQPWASREKSHLQPDYSGRQNRDYVPSSNQRPQPGRDSNRASAASAAAAAAAAAAAVTAASLMGDDSDDNAQASSSESDAEFPHGDPDLGNNNTWGGYDETTELPHYTGDFGSDHQENENESGNLSSDDNDEDENEDGSGDESTDGSNGGGDGGVDDGSDGGTGDDESSSASEEAESIEEDVNNQGHYPQSQSWDYGQAQAQYSGYDQGQYQTYDENQDGAYTAVSGFENNHGSYYEQGHQYQDQVYDGVEEDDDEPEEGDGGEGYYDEDGQGGDDDDEDYGDGWD